MSHDWNPNETQAKLAYNLGGIELVEKVLDIKGEDYNESEESDSTDQA